MAAILNVWFYDFFNKLITQSSSLSICGESARRWMPPHNLINLINEPHTWEINNGSRNGLISSGENNITNVNVATNLRRDMASQRPVTRSFDVFFDLRLNKRLSEQSWGWWFETPSCPLWRHVHGIRIEAPLLKRKEARTPHMAIAIFCMSLFLVSPQVD